MSQNNTNRDIRRFETDGDGNTTRVLLNTDEPLGLLDGDYQEQLEELENRLNAITGGAYNNTVQISHGGTGAESAGEAMSNLVTALDVISSLNQNTLSFVAQQTGGSPSTIGKVYRVRQDAVAEQIGALKASNNLSDLDNAVGALATLLQNINDVTIPPGVPATAIIDSLKVLLSNYGTGVTPLKISMKDLVDYYLSEYFTKKSNNLSDLQSKSSAVSNLFDGLSSAGIPVINGTVELMAKKSEFPSGTGKITLEDLFEDYLLSAFNTEYGMTKDSQTNLYGFTGNAATATASGKTQSIYTGNPTNLLGQRFFDVQRKTFGALSGTTTVTFDTLTTNSNVLNYNILSVSVVEVASGKTAIVKGFSVSCASNQSNNNYVYTVSAEIEAQGSGIDVTLEVLYSYQYQQ